MFAIEFIGLGIALIHLAIAVVALLWPPKELKEKYFHAAYIGSMVIISGIFTYLIFVNHQELASSRARADEVARRLEEKNKISTQADAVAKIASIQWKRDVQSNCTCLICFFGEVEGANS